MVKEKFTPQKASLLVLFFFIVGLVFNFAYVNSLDKQFSQTYLNLMIVSFSIIGGTILVSRKKAILPIADLTGDNALANSALGIGLGAIYVFLSVGTKSLFPYMQLESLAVTQNLFVLSAEARNVLFTGILAPVVEELTFLTFFFIMVYFLEQYWTKEAAYAVTFVVNSIVFALFHLTAYKFAYPGISLTDPSGVLLFLFSGAGLSAMVFRGITNALGLFTESYLVAILFHIVVNTGFLLVAGDLISITTLLVMIGAFLTLLGAGVIVKKQKEFK